MLVYWKLKLSLSLGVEIRFFLSCYFYSWGIISLQKKGGKINN